MDSHVGDLVADEGLRDALNLVGDVGRVALLESRTERLVEKIRTIVLTVGAPDNHTTDAYTLNLDGDLISRERHLL